MVSDMTSSQDIATADRTRGLPWLGIVAWLAVLSCSIMIASGGFAELLPARRAAQIGHNAEGFMLVVLLSPWLAYVRSRQPGRPPVALVGGLSVASLLIGLYLGFVTDIGVFATLDESFYGAALLVPYVWLPRPLPRFAWTLPILAFLVPALFSQTTVGWQLAETYGFFLLVPIYLDFIDRRVLEPRKPLRPRLLMAWVAVLLVVPVIVSAVRVEHPEGFVESVIRYLSRPTEAMVACLLFTAYFSILRPSRPKSPHARAAARHG